MDDDPDTLHHGDLVLDEIRENPPGRDGRHLDQEYVAFKNEGSTELDVSGWSVEDEAGNTFTFPEETLLKPGERIRLHSGTGERTDADVYWGSDRPRWRNTGDTVLVRDADGVVRVRETYNE